MPKKIPVGEPRLSEPRKPLDAWDRYGRGLIRAEFAQQDKTPKDIADFLKGTGLGSSSPRAIAQRITRGSFTFGFALRVLRALGVEYLYIGQAPELASDANRPRVAGEEVPSRPRR